MERTVQSFANIGELDSILEGMNSYEVLPAVVYHENFLAGLDGKVGIMTNVTKKRHCMATSLEYRSDHRTAFGFAADAIRRREGAGIHGKVETWQDRAYLTTMFDEIKLVDNSNKDNIISLVSTSKMPWTGKSPSREMATRCA